MGSLALLDVAELRALSHKLLASCGGWGSENGGEGESTTQLFLCLKIMGLKKEDFRGHEQR